MTGAGVTDITAWIIEHQFTPPGGEARPSGTYDGEEYLQPILEMAREFERAHPEYAVRVEGHDPWTMAEEVARAAERGEAPDIAEYYATATQLAYDTYTPDGKPVFTSIERALGGRKEVVGERVLIDDIEPLARNFYTYQGDQFSVPMTATTPLLYSNMTILRKAGIDTPPRTWDELVTACEAVARLDEAPAYGAAWPNNGWIFQQALAQQGGLIANNGNGREARATVVDLASKEMISWVEWLRDLHAAGHYVYSEGAFWSAFETFARQDAVFALSSSKQSEEFVRSGEENGFEVTASPMPFNSSVPYVGSLVSGYSLFLRNGLDEAKRDGALAFIQHLLKPSSIIRWHRAHGFLPITNEAYDTLEGEGWFAANPHHRAASDQLRTSAQCAATSGALLGDFAGVQHAMTRAMKDVLLSGADPGPRFEQATEEAQRLLDEHNAACLRPVPSTPARLDVY